MGFIDSIHRRVCVLICVWSRWWTNCHTMTHSNEPHSCVSYNVIMKHSDEPRPYALHGVMLCVDCMILWGGYD